VTQYYYLLLGATPLDVGNLNSLAVAGTLILAPLFGWALDNAKAHVGLIACTALCTAGCLIRGLANGAAHLYVAAVFLGLGGNLWPLVLAFVSTSTHSDLRSVVVSGFIGQQRLMGLLGKGLYPLLHVFLVDVVQIPDKLTRYRVAMSICTLFCTFGTVKLSLAQWRTKSYVEVGEPTVVEAPVLHTTAQRPRETDSEEWEPEIVTVSTLNVFRFGLISLAIIAQASFSICLSVLWPLYLKAEFQWGSKEYSTVLFLATIAALAGIVASPALERLLGQANVAGLSLGGAGLLAGIGFSQYATVTVQDVGVLAASAVVYFHIAMVVSLAFCLGVAEPCLKSLATIQMPPALQGRACKLFY